MHTILQPQIQHHCNLLGYVLQCRRGYTPFRHNDLECFSLRGITVGIKAKHAAKLRLILGRLNVSVEPRDMALPGLHLHPLRGDRRGTWAVSVSGNWRVTFRFSGPDVEDVDYEDYH